jgi:hypothetical protein
MIAWDRRVEIEGVEQLPLVSIVRPHHGRPRCNTLTESLFEPIHTAFCNNIGHEPNYVLACIFVS